LQKDATPASRAVVPAPGGATLENMDLKITPKQLILLLAGWAFALSAAAQYQWIGKDGRKVFSDRPPPADIQEKNILKQPGGKRAAAPTLETAEPADATTATAAAAPVAKAPAPKLSGKDTELQIQKKKLEDEEAARKKAQEEKVAQGLADNCMRAKRGLASFQSGTRISTVNAKGEREFMDDATRAVESKRLQSIIDSDCK
jgi:hypothetical protein